MNDELRYHEHWISWGEYGTRFVVFKDGRHFIGQGLDVDYVSAGDTYGDAIDNFSKGFTASVIANLEKLGTAKWFMHKRPPSQVFYNAIVESAKTPMKETS